MFKSLCISILTVNAIDACDYLKKKLNEELVKKVKEEFNKNENKTNNSDVLKNFLINKNEFKFLSDTLYTDEFLKELVEDKKDKLKELIDKFINNISNNLTHKEKSRFIITGFAYGKNILDKNIQLYYIYEVNFDNISFLVRYLPDIKTIEDLKEDLLSKYKLS